MEVGVEMDKFGNDHAQTSSNQAVSALPHVPRYQGDHTYRTLPHDGASNKLATALSSLYVGAMFQATINSLPRFSMTSTCFL